MVTHFIKVYNKKMKKKITGITKNALQILVDYDWPGNIRELKNALERLAARYDWPRPVATVVKLGAGLLAWVIGGFVGAALVKAGPGALVTSGLVKIGAFMILAPLIGLVVGFAMMVLTVRTFRRETPGRVDKVFRRGQLLSAAAYSLGHGTNDAQKTMGIIAILLFSTGHLGPEFYVPFWVVLAAHAAISLGTLSGGWRIVKTMGMRITKLRPIGGFCAETAGAVTLIGTALGGIPVSTTHTISGSIMGVGAIQRLSAVRWGVAGRIVWAWIMTVPASAAVAAVAWLLIRVLVA